MYHVELGDELLEVGVVRRHVDPRLRHRVEHAVGVVEATVLQAQHALGYLRKGNYYAISSARYSILGNSKVA